jgi:uncharacterized protein YdaU (DUF1376 family)
MDLPWFKQFPGDFNIQTDHLSPAQVGAFVRLRHAIWARPTCSVPSDLGTLRRITRLPTRDFQKLIAPVLDLCTLLDNGELTIPELRDQFAYAQAKRAKCVAAGKLGGERKASLLSSSTTPLPMPSLRRIPSKNNRSILANANPNALADADIYQNQNLKIGGLSAPDFPDGSVGSRMQPTCHGLNEALSRLGGFVKGSTDDGRE